MTYIMTEYDAALKSIYDTGWDLPDDRTGVGCKVKLGLTTRYDISERVPVMTYRHVFWKSFVKEVLWYITGSDKISDLQAMGCNVWTPWINKDFTDRTGFDETSIGYGYGPNLINFGGDIKYGTLETPGFGLAHGKKKGVNQLDYVIDTLRKNPSSRQAMFVLWRPDKLNEVLLPPCHFGYHFLVSPNEQGEMKVLNCQLFQRSGDYPIGIPANLFMASIFTYLIAQQLNMVPGELIHSGSHCHIYSNAMNSTKEYLERCSELPARPSPILKINKKDSIYDYTINDFSLEEYFPYPKIDFEIAV